jgi:hypothetical protein
MTPESVNPNLLYITQWIEAKFPELISSGTTASEFVMGEIVTQTQNLGIAKILIGSFDFLFFSIATYLFICLTKYANTREREDRYDATAGLMLFFSALATFGTSIGILISMSEIGHGLVAYFAPLA